MTLTSLIANRPLLFGSRLMQWASAVIVMGLASSFIHNYSAGEHIIYVEVIATTATAFYLVPLATAFTKTFHWQWIPLDLIYSYLWLAAVVFESEDYNYLDCSNSDPNGLGSCSQKYALEAFIFLGFFFTVITLIIQTFVWVEERPAAATRYEKSDPTRPSGETV